MENNIKSACQLFEELGYKFVSYGDEHIVEFDKVVIKDYEYKKIVFDIRRKFFWAGYFKNKYDSNGKLINKIHTIVVLDIEELKAINQQCKELGWLDE